MYLSSFFFCNWLSYAYYDSLCLWTNVYLHAYPIPKEQQTVTYLYRQWEHVWTPQQFHYPNDLEKPYMGSFLSQWQTPVREIRISNFKPKNHPTSCCNMFFAAPKTNFSNICSLTSSFQIPFWNKAIFLYKTWQKHLSKEKPFQGKGLKTSTPTSYTLAATYGVLLFLGSSFKSSCFKTKNTPWKQTHLHHFSTGQITLW